MLKLENIPFRDILEELLTNMTLSNKEDDTLMSLLQTANDVLKVLLTNSTTYLETVNSIVEEVRDYLEV